MPAVALSASLLLLHPGVLAAQTAVKAVQPTSITLRAGERGVDLSIQGASLDLVRALEVSLGGKLVTDVVARTVKSSATDLVVAIEAAATAQAVKGARLLLVTDRARVEVPADIVVEAAAPPPPPAPRLLDLQISANQLDALQTATLTVSIDRAAPAEGFPISLSSSAPGTMSLPSTVSVRAGATTASLNVTAGDPAQDATTTLTAAAGGPFRSVVVTVRSAQPSPVEDPHALSLAIGSFLVTITDPNVLVVPPTPVSLQAGQFVVVITNPEAEFIAPDPVALNVGTFLVTIAVPPGNDR